MLYYDGYNYITHIMFYIMLYQKSIMFLLCSCHIVHGYTTAAWSRWSQVCWPPPSGPSKGGVPDSQVAASN